MLDAWLDLVHGSACLGCDRPGRLLCRRCAAFLPDGGREVRPTPCPEGLVRCFAAGEYADPLRQLILHHKEHRGFSLCGPLGRLLAGVARDLIQARVQRRPDQALGTGLIVLVPVPSRRTVVRERGHDPMLRITRVAAAETRRLCGWDVRVSELLRQRGPVADQAGLDSVGRSENVAGRMKVRGTQVAALSRQRRPVVAVVCDDVITTGATGRESQRALSDAGISVLGIACIAATRKRLHQS